MHTNMRARARTHTYTHTHMHARTHTHTHTQTIWYMGKHSMQGRADSKKLHPGICARVRACVCACMLEVQNTSLPALVH